jgi:hypothetical protein
VDARAVFNAGQGRPAQRAHAVPLQAFGDEQAELRSVDFTTELLQLVHVHLYRNLDWVNGVDAVARIEQMNFAALRPCARGKDGRNAQEKNKRISHRTITLRFRHREDAVSAGDGELDNAAIIRRWQLR